MRQICLPLFFAFLACAGLGLNLGCELLDDCNREGCEAIEKPARSTMERGIAGAIASQSDVVANGCAECGLSDGMLKIWTSAARVNSEQDAFNVWSSGPPVQDIALHHRYETPLPAGEYLACIDQAGQGYCAAITVPTKGVVTVHLRYVYGPPSLIVFEPGAKDPREDRKYVLQRSP